MTLFGDVTEEDFEQASSDGRVVRGMHVKTNAPPGTHDDIVVALALATFTPGRFNPNAKVDPRVLQSMLGRSPKPRRASFRIG